MTPEGRVKKLVKHMLEAYGERIEYFMPVVAGYGARHVDFIVCAGGHYFVVETKRPGEDATQKQKEKMRDVRLAGGATFVIAGEDDPRVADLRAHIDYCVKFPASHSPWLKQYTREPEALKC